MKKRIISLLTVIVMLLFLFPVSALAKTGDRSFADDVWLVIRDELKRERYILDSKDDTLTLDELEITLYDHVNTRDYINKSVYNLHVGFVEGWDNENNKPIFREVQAPFGLAADPNGMERGRVVYSVYAEAKEGSGYTGVTSVSEFVVIEKNSLDGEAADVNFGEIYRRETSPAENPFFSIPKNRERDPIVYDACGNQLDSSKYTLTFFERGTGKQLSSMPSNFGEYTARIEGIEPYYGVSNTDFDIIDGPELYAVVHGSDRKYYENNTIFVQNGGSVDIRFVAVDHDEVLIIGWLAEDVRKAGFDEAPEPVFFPGDNNAYAHISANNLPAGTEGDIIYNWYRYDDIVYGGSYHWDTAVPLWSGKIHLEVAPDRVDYILGDTDGDNEITVSDATILQRSCAGMDVNLTEAELIRGDADQSGDIEIIDATFLQRWLADMPTACDIIRPMQY